MRGLWCGLAAWLLGAGLPPAYALAQADDLITVDYRAVLTAEGHFAPDPDERADDKLSVTVTEQTVWRVVRWDDVAQLKLESLQSHLGVEGGGKWASGDLSSTWRWVAERQPTTPLCGVHLTARGTGHVTPVDFAKGYLATRQTSGLEGAYTPVAGTPAWRVMSDGVRTADPDERPPLFTAFTFDPKAKRVQIPGHGSHSVTLPAPAQGTASVITQFTLSFGPPPDVEAVLTPEGDLAAWLPAAGTKAGQPGNTMGFKVDLRDRRTGQPPTRATATFEFRLANSSRLPGSCGNSPWADADPDLQLRRAENPSLTPGDEGQTARSAAGLTSSRVVVACFDGGAHGTLSCTARLSDGEEVTAQLKDGRTEAPLPVDDDGDAIADVWATQHDAVGQDPATDQDDTPAGNHFDGDGLTLFEEYRGFLEDGTHLRTDPQIKDLFLCDTIGGRTRPAWAKFEQLTRIKLHPRLTRAELSDSRVINRHHGGVPHVVDQHGLLVWPSVGTGSCEAVGDGPGPPRTCREVRLDAAIPDTQQGRGGDGVSRTYPSFVPTVVHELLHCVNVWHHGQCDEQVWWVAETVGGAKRFYEYASASSAGHPDQGAEIVIVDESGTRVYNPNLPYWATPRLIWLGRRSGQHSGVEDCVMRYDCAQAYVRPNGARSSLRYYGNEPVGQRLCASATGTGVNAAGHAPAPRYGDAAADRGDCLDQICVNDRYEPLPGQP